MEANELTILTNKANEFKKLSEFISVKIVGKWIWIEGGTKPLKDKLKAMGCRWACKKKAWCWYQDVENSPKKWYRRKTKNLSDIEDKYGRIDV